MHDLLGVIRHRTIISHSQNVHFTSILIVATIILDRLVGVEWLLVVNGSLGTG
jgi:hypothetical protein